MPSYEYRCGSCRNAYDHVFTIGEAPRILVCDDCGGITQLVIGAGVQIAPSALEGKGAKVRDALSKDATLDRDLDAYKRMRHRGLQPESINGSSRQENEVGDNFDLTLGARLKKGLKRFGAKESYETTKRRVREGQQAAAESGWDPKVKP